MRRWQYALLGLCLAACGDGKIAAGSLDGARIYKDACARCHGEGGVPLAGVVARTGVKPLNSASVAGLSDVQIGEQIRKGSKNRMMPAFQGSLSDKQIEALTAYVRTFNPAPAPAVKATP